MERHTPVEVQTHYDTVIEEILLYEELGHQPFQEYVPGYQAYEERYSESEESYSSEESQPSIRYVGPEIVVHLEFYNPGNLYTFRRKETFSPISTNLSIYSFL